MNRLLLITYYFPTCGGAAVQRWLRLLPLLIREGFAVTVLTTKDGDYPVIDRTLPDLVPREVEVIRTYTPVFGRLWKTLTNRDEPLPYGSLDSSQTTSFAKKLLYWMRLNLIIPDARVIWNPFAKRKALQLCREKRFDWVITSGPPHSTHLIGLYLKQHIKIKWLADFRDPWTQIYYLKLQSQNALVRKINNRLEQKVVKTADLNLVISNDIAKQLPDGRKRVFYNGFNQDQFKDITYQKTDKFRIKYIGQLTAGQDIASLLEFLSTKAEQNSIRDFSFDFIGTRYAASADYHFPVAIKNYLPHAQALEEMVNCELLILLINSYTENLGMLTTKLFEYIASRTPILCLGPVEGEAADIITKASAGFVSPILNMKVWDFIIDLYQNWQQSNPVRNDSDISQWSVQQQIGDLVSLLSS